MRRLALAFLLLSSTTVLAATPYDGVYKGGTSSAGGAGVRCPDGQAFNVIVRNGVFNWRFEGESVPVTINPDGTFSGQHGRRYINGKITGNTFSAQTTGERCNYAWSHTR